MSKIHPLILLATLAIITALPQTVLADGNGHGQSQVKIHANFHTQLSGHQQVPAIDTEAFGFASVRLVDNGTAIDFRVVVCNIANVTHSHIHVGAAGTNGPVIIPFFDQPNAPFSSTHGCRVLASGTRTQADLVPRSDSTPPINNWNDFVQALLSGNTYVNVHTTAEPLGEIRGQLELPGHHH
jgi:hypothetical protein